MTAPSSRRKRGGHGKMARADWKISIIYCLDNHRFGRWMGQLPLAAASPTVGRTSTCVLTRLDCDASQSHQRVRPGASRRFSARTRRWTSCGRQGETHRLTHEPRRPVPTLSTRAPGLRCLCQWRTPSGTNNSSNRPPTFPSQLCLPRTTGVSGQPVLPCLHTPNYLLDANN